MTDLTPDDDEDILLLDAFEGDQTALATVEADARLTGLLTQMRANRDALRATEIAIDPVARASSIAAAMDVFDNMTASADAKAATAAVAKKRHRARTLLRSLGAVAASTAVVVGIVAIGPNLNSGDSDSTASGDSSADAADVAAATTTTTASATATTAAAEAARSSPAPEAAVAAAESATTGAPATTSSPAATIEQGDAALDGPESGDMIDPAIRTCAEQTDTDITTWIMSSPGDDAGEVASAEQDDSAGFVIVTDGGFEVDVVLNLDTCDFVSISEPRPPRP